MAGVLRGRITVADHAVPMYVRLGRDRLEFRHRHHRKEADKQEEEYREHAERAEKREDLDD